MMVTYWLHHALTHGDGNHVRGHAGIAVPVEERGAHRNWRCVDVTLENVLWVLVDHGNRGGGDGGTRVGRERVCGVGQRRGAGLCGRRVERAVTGSLGELAVV